MISRVCGGKQGFNDDGDSRSRWQDCLKSLGYRSPSDSKRWSFLDDVHEEEQDKSVLEDEEPLEDVEHLQLTLQEAFFLCWGLDCLTILDPSTVILVFLRCCLSD